MLRPAAKSRLKLALSVSLSLTFEPGLSGVSGEDRGAWRGGCAQSRPSGPASQRWLRRASRDLETPGTAVLFFPL